MKKFMTLLLLMFVSLAVLGQQTLSQPCAKWRWSDDPEYTITGTIDTWWQTNATFFGDATDRTFVKFKDGRQACFTEHLNPDDVPSGTKVTIVYQRHCSKVCYTYVRTERGEK